MERNPLSMEVILKVSISLITYNHSKFIRKAIESILMQQTDFDYELIIGDDCSTDNTRDILQEYQAAHPEVIRLILPEKKPPGIPGKINFVSTIHAAKGKYVAMLDGDDYWTDPHKLQRQADFMDAHPDYSICFHNAQLIFEGLEGQERAYNREQEETKFTVEDLILRDWFIHSGSILYRRAWFPKVPDSFYDMPSGDIPLGILLAAQGPVGYLPQSMSVYRKNPQGVSVALECHQAAQGYENRLYIYKTLDRELGGAYSHYFDKAQARFRLEKAKQHLKAGEREAFVETLNSCRWEHHLYSPSQRSMLFFLQANRILPWVQGFMQKLIYFRLKVRKLWSA